MEGIVTQLNNKILVISRKKKMSNASCLILQLYSNNLSPYVRWVGKWTKNNFLLSTRRTNEGNFLVGPEDLAVRPDTQDVYASDANRIVKVVDENSVEQIIQFDGVIVLGLAFEDTDTLWAAVVGVNDISLGGIYRIDLTGDVSSTKIVTDTFPNSIGILNGYLYYSNSTDMPLCNGNPVVTLSNEFIRGRRAGTLTRFQIGVEDPNVEIVVNGLFVSNGVTVLPNQQTVLVASMFERVIYQYNPATGISKPWSEVLAGYIDNLSYDSESNSVWAGLVQPQIDPFLRIVYKYLPTSRYLFSFIPLPTQDFGGVVRISADNAPPRTEGFVDLFLNDKNGTTISGITDVLRVDNQLFFGSFNNFIGRYTLPN